MTTGGSSPIRTGPVLAMARVAGAGAALYLFLTGVHGMGEGFGLLGREVLEGFFRATENPVTGLMVGLLATALVQSSSVVTSMIVGLVAAPENPLPLADAIPMVMGSNIGTTVTNTLVSLGHVGRKDEFRRAFAVATCHDFFNNFTVLILLPLEIATGFLAKTATWLAGWIAGAGGAAFDSPFKSALKAGVEPLHWLVESLLPGNTTWHGAALALLSAIVIFAGLLALVTLLRQALQRSTERSIEFALGRGALRGIAIGAIATAAVQSSSITTSLLVPLAGAGVLTLQQAFPVTLGANIGTTVTALLASLAVSGPNARLGVTIALVHLLFNLAGTLLIYPVPQVRRVPLACAEALAGLAIRSRTAAVVYVLALFYLLPAAVVIVEAIR